MNTLDAMDMVIRVGLAFLVGLILGFERERHGRAAGMRTTMLVCVSSAIVMLFSQYLFLESSPAAAGWRPDPARLAAGVLAGMGFLGAGVIVRQENVIHGVTTAAVLWFSSILGLVLGGGYLVLGLAGFTVALIALFLLPAAEAYIQSDRYAVLTIVSAGEGPSQKEVVDRVEGLCLGAKLKHTGLEIDREEHRRTMRFEVKIKKSRMSQCENLSVELISGLPGVVQVRWY